MDINDAQLIETLRQLSEQEFKERAFGSTEQYLEVLEVEKQDGLPVAARVQLLNNNYVTYYPIRNERFYYTHYFSVDGGVKLCGDSIEPANTVYLRVISDFENLENILSLTTLKPTKAWQKGEPYSGKAGKAGRIYNNSGFDFEPDTNLAGDFETKISSLLDALTPHCEEILALGEQCETFIRTYWDAYYGNTMLGGWWMDKEMIARLADMKLSVDFDLYVGGTPFN